ncbi:MAG TPA: hypothetical protein O0X58_03560, partial [Methanocorpusculum sp.]|nr:hypothetical protein [Methanocorpusculum sp.]
THHLRDKYISFTCENVSMKKIAGLLLLTAAVILTAGCVTTADPIVGSWQTTEPIQFDGYTLSYQVTFEEDGTGELIYSYSDVEGDNIFPLLWKKTGDTYHYEMFCSFTISEDGKTMTDDYQYTYRLEKDGEMFGGVWMEEIPKGAEADYYYTYVFNEDGTGVETIHETGNDPDVGYFLWREYADNQIIIRYLYTYTFEDGKMKTSMGEEAVFEEVDGIWVETPQVGNHVTTYEFCDDGICVRHIYDGETNERIGFYKYYYIPSVMTDEKIAALPLLTPLLPLFSTPIGGVLLSADIYELEFLEDGTLQDVEDREILERVSSA